MSLTSCAPLTPRHGTVYTWTYSTGKTWGRKGGGVEMISNEREWYLLWPSLCFAVSWASVKDVAYRLAYMYLHT